MTRKRALTILVAALAFAAPTVALAHTITRTQIRAAAREAARSIKSQTGASSTAVLSCRRTSDHRGRCKVEARYSSGARRCVTAVGIRLVGDRARWRIGDTTCY